MINIINRIRRKLSLKLTFGIMLFLIAIFVVSLGILFMRSRQLVREEAMERAEQELDNVVMRVNGMMNEVETATMTARWHLTDDNLQPDSLLNFARRIVAMNPNFDGCSISTEPNYFPQIGRYFSVYAYHKGDSVVSKTEDPYEYFDKVYYKTPLLLGKPSWVEAYAEDVNGVVSGNFDDLIVSFGVPIRNSKRETIGVISTDLSMPWLSQVISAYKPYPNAYSVMLGADGQYLIHPDTAKLMKKTIFSDADTKNNQDLITLGHDMVSGNSGMLTVKIRGKRCLVLYKSLKRAPWSIALVCPESDILAGYTKLLYILIPLLVFGLLVILAFCLNVITSMVTPINELTDKLSYITHGHYNEPIERTSRRDVIGRLQNNFAEMQEALSKHITSLQEVNNVTCKLNSELEKASVMARKADESKSEFLKDVTHQIRTPLNIINGFTQVLRDDSESIPRDEVEGLIDTMLYNAVGMNRMINMLLVAANTGKDVKINVMEEVNVHELVDALTYLYAHTPPYTVDLVTDIKLLDTFTVRSNREFLGKALAELLFNAKKFTTDGHVKLTAMASGITVIFMVEDTGPGISEETQARLFDNFEKGNIFDEGLGMGLPTCRQMIRMIGGELKFDAKYTEGSRFVVVIPNSRGEVELR
jgi:signal transduction histidine kinase